MGLIVPSKNQIVKNTQIDKHIMDMALAEIATQSSEDADGNIVSNSIRGARSAWEMALYAESPRDRLAALKFITERIGGKPKVLEDDEKEELPEVVFRITQKDSKRLKELADREDVSVENNDDKVIVDIEGEPRMEF